MNVMRIRYLIGAKLQQSSIFTNAFHSYFLKAIEHLFLRVYRRYKPTRDVGRTLEKLVNHSPSVRELQKLFECSPNIPRGIITPVRVKRILNFMTMSYAI